jgi:hypothetical protein
VFTPTEGAKAPLQFGQFENELAEKMLDKAVGRGVKCGHHAIVEQLAGYMTVKLGLQSWRDEPSWTGQVLGVDIYGLKGTRRQRAS